MADFILMNGDLALFQPQFGAATVVVRPGNLMGSGKSTIQGNKICIEGDEKKLIVAGCTYISGPHIIPGTGNIKIQALAPNQKAKKTKVTNKKALLKGMLFDAVFEVVAPAQQPSATGTVPDAVPKYFGKGQFNTKNTKRKGT